jgi:hypothetical protein
MHWRQQVRTVLTVKPLPLRVVSSFLFFQAVMMYLKENNFQNKPTVLVVSAGQALPGSERNLNLPFWFYALLHSP